MGTFILQPPLHSNWVPSRLDLLEIENVIRVLFQRTIRMRNHSLEVLRRSLPSHLGLLFFVRVGRFVVAADTPEGVEEVAEPMVTFGMFPLLVLLG